MKTKVGTLVERLRAAKWNEAADEIEQLQTDREYLLVALKGVIAVADRKTDEFDRAHAAVARCEV